MKKNVKIVVVQYGPYDRQARCRYDRSQNKPFYDSRHLDLGFNDGDETLK